MAGPSETVSAQPISLKAKCVFKSARLAAIAAFGMGLAACAQKYPAGHWAVEATANGYKARIFFAPDNVRLFLFDAKRKLVDLTNARVTMTIEDGGEVITRTALHRAESRVMVPRAMVQAFINENPGYTPEHPEAVDTAEESEFKHRFFWAVVEDGHTIPEGAKAEFVISNVNKRKEAIRFGVEVRYGYLEGYACPKHFRRIYDQAGSCSRDGLALEKVQCIYRCAMDQKVTSLNPDERCWVCDMELDKTPLFSER